MSSKKQAFIFTVALTLACFGFFALLNSGTCPFCPKDVSSSKNNSRGFLRLPDMNCYSNPPFLVILVTSRIGQQKARMAIRETWGKERIVANKRIVTYFLLGKTLNSSHHLSVTTESLVYKDIIQKDFMDTYFNLTLKTLMGLEWVHKFCPQSSFVMKTDCDMFVNPYYLTELLLKRNRTTRFFTGALRMNDSPIRDPNSKWYVSKQEYPGNKYPPFSSGTGYVFSTDVASEVYIISKTVPFFKLEDVFVGMCLAELSIVPESLHSRPTFFAGKVAFSPCTYKKIVTSHYMSSNEILLYWNALEKSMDEKCLDS